MQIPSTIRNIPHQIQTTWNRIPVTIQKTKDWVNQKFQTISETDFWKYQVHPFYERNIELLQPKDGVKMAVLAVIAVTISIVAFSRFGFAAFPLVLGFDTLCVVGGLVYLKHTVKQRHNTHAWDHVEAIRQSAIQTSSINQNFSEIQEEKKILSEKRYDHLTSELQQLDAQITKFRDNVLVLNYKNQKKIVLAHLDTLTLLVPTDLTEKALIIKLRQEIEKVGTHEQNLAKLEKQKQKLCIQSQTAIIQSHIQELTQQIQELVKAVSKPHLVETKQNFIIQLEELQRRLDPTKNIPLISLEQLEEEEDLSEVESDTEIESPTSEKGSVTEIAEENEEDKTTHSSSTQNLEVDSVPSSPVNEDEESEEELDHLTHSRIQEINSDDEELILKQKEIKKASTST